MGLSGFGGLDPNPFKHIRRYAAHHPEIGIALGDIGHDATAAVIRDGQIVFAIEEERLNRSKHYMGVPERAAIACASAVGEALDAIHLSYYLHPSLEHRKRRVETCAPFLNGAGVEAIEREFNHVQHWVSQYQQRWPRLRYVDHHLAHSASAFYCSGFERALIVVIDGQGESSSTTVMLGDAEGLHPVVQLPVTSSLGILYAAITAFLGFEPIEDEYKIMGLAAYGDGDEFRSFFEEIIHYEDKGAFYIPSLLDKPIERMMKWESRLGVPRTPSEPIEDRHIAIADSLQKAVERTMMRLLEYHESRLKTRHLCLAGGVALNCSMNGVIDRSGLFERMFVQPAAGDPGAALGAAFVSYYAEHPNAPRYPMEHVYWGPEYSDVEVLRALEAYRSEICWTRPVDYIGEVARLLAQGKVLGWFQGRMEFGPRALGNRSILADPRRAEMKDRVNQMVKKREEFRPFAPSVTYEAAENYFDLRARNQYEYMTIAVRAKPERRQEIPAVVHVNGTARVHVVRREVNPRYWELLVRFGQETGVPVLLNTSFNIKGEPIVCTPEDAIRCFIGTGIDYLAIQGYLVEKCGNNVRPQ